MLQASVVPSKSQLSWVLWNLGYANQAHAQSERTLELANRLGRPFSMAFALMHAIALDHFRRDYANIPARAESLLDIARENGFPYWSAVASMIIGRMLVGHGNYAVGIIRMRDAMALLAEAGGELIHGYAQMLLAEAYLGSREPEKGLAIVAEALRLIEASGQRMLEAEIWRLRGELLSTYGAGADEIERSLQHALDIAHEQQARSLELRSATSLARFLQLKGRPAEAASILNMAMAGINQGQQNADFQDAVALVGISG